AYIDHDAVDEQAAAEEDDQADDRPEQEHAAGAAPLSGGGLHAGHPARISSSPAVAHTGPACRGLRVGIVLRRLAEPGRPVGRAGPGRPAAGAGVPSAVVSWTRLGRRVVEPTCRTAVPE